MTDLGIVILAAGLGRRFGGNKPLALFRGRRLLEYPAALSAKIEGAETAAVVSADETRAFAETLHLKTLWNPHPEEGIASSVRIGTEYFRHKDAVLFLLSDMPLLTAESVQRLLNAFDWGKPAAACLRSASHSGNPAVFSRSCFPDLLNLSGDSGGKRVLKKYEGSVLSVSCAEDELSDADTKEALSELAEKSS